MTIPSATRFVTRPGNGHSHATFLLTASGQAEYRKGRDNRAKKGIQANMMAMMPSTIPEMFI